MIGMELLNLMYGDPMQRAMAPRPAAPPPQQQPSGPISPTTGQPMPMSSADAARNFHPNNAGGVVPNAPPSPSGAPGQPPPQPQPSLPQSGPPSTAPQSPSDLGQLYLQLMQRDRAANAIDRGLAGMAVANAAPGYQGAIANALAPQQYNAGQDMNTLMQLQYMQQMANMPAPAGIDPNVWRGLPPDAKLKTFEQAAQSGIAIQQKGLETKQADLLEAQQKAPDMLNQIDQMKTSADQIRNATEADGVTPVMQSILSNPVKKAAAIKLMSQDEKTAPGVMMSMLASAGLTQQEQDTLMKMKTLNNQVYGEAFQSTGTKRSTQEVKNLREGLSPLTNFTQSPQGYMDQFEQFQRQLDKSYVNVLGGAGRIDEIPDNLKWDMSDPQHPKPLVDTAYLPGGDKYSGSGGQWASNPPKTRGGAVQVTSVADVQKLPHGTPFVIPSGPNQGKIGYAQ